MIWRPCDLNLVMISSVASKCQDFKVGMPVFQPLHEVKLKASKLKSWLFEASIMTIFKSQGLHIIRIKYWKGSGSGNPPFLIPGLRKIAIYVLKMKFYVLFCKRLYYRWYATSVYVYSNVRFSNSLLSKRYTN